VATFLVGNLEFQKIGSFLPDLHVRETRFMLLLGKCTAADAEVICFHLYLGVTSYREAEPGGVRSIRRND